MSSSVKIVRKDPAEMKRFNDDDDALAIEFTHRIQDFSVFDTAAQIDASFASVCSGGFFYLQFTDYIDPVRARMIVLSHDDDDVLPHL